MGAPCPQVFETEKAVTVAQMLDVIVWAAQMARTDYAGPRLVGDTKDPAWTATHTSMLARHLDAHTLVREDIELAKRAYQQALHEEQQSRRTGP